VQRHTNRAQLADTCVECSVPVCNSQFRPGPAPQIYKAPVKSNSHLYHFV